MVEFHFAAVVGLAFLGDFILGEPPNRLHPVAWMGHAITLVRRSAPASGNTLRFLWGSALVCGGVVAVALVGWFIQRACLRFPFFVSVVIQAVVLKSTFSISSLAKAAKLVRTALLNDDLDSARHHVAYHLVSRDVSRLDASKLSAATIESVAENTSDSVIAPLFYFAIAGLPGALVYRFVNTCDAMIGYRTPELEWFGKAAARTDDLLNLLPARMTAALILVIGGLRAGRFRKAIGIWLRDYSLTASPNAGHPMSAAAGVLGVVLEKEDHYVLGAGQPSPTDATIQDAISLLWKTSLAGAVLLVATVVLWDWGTIPMSQPFDPFLEAYHGGIDSAEMIRLGIKPELAIDFSSNILPFGPSPLVRAAIQNAPIDRYPDRECGLLRRGIAELHSIEVDRILVGNGCSELIHWIASALIRPGEPVLIVGPTFSEYARASQLANGSVRECLAVAENGFACPCSAIDSALEGGAVAMVWICNPNNPTGQSVTRERLIGWLNKYPRTVFVVDEAYIEFADSVESVIACEMDNLIVLRSMTKAHALAGLRLGYAVMSNANQRIIRGRRAPWSVNAIAQAAGLAAIQDQAYYLNAITRLHEVKRSLLQGLVRNGFRPLASDTCFFLLPIEGSADVRSELLRDGLVVRDCQSFGIPDYLRIAVHEPAHNLRLIESLSKRKRAVDKSSLSGLMTTPDRLVEAPVDENTQPLEDWDDAFRQGLHRLFRRRRDVRRFRRDAIPEGSIRRWIEAACLAPSVGLSQPWRFVSVSSDACRENVVKEFETQNEAAASRYDAVNAERYRALKLAGLRESPEQLAIFVELDPTQGRGLGRSTMPETVAYSVVAAIQNFWLAARSEGVGVGWVSILRPESIAAILDVPSTWHLIAYLCIGFPEDDIDEVPELERKGWEQRVEVPSHWLQR